MATESKTADDISPTLRDNDHLNADKYGTKLVDKTDKLHEKAHHLGPHHDEKEKEHEKQPAGGFDATPIPKAPPGYTLKITFHSAKDLPFADLSMTSDPYIYAVLKTDLPKRHKQDPDLRIRTPTVHRDLNPVWDVPWIIAHVPASGFHLKGRLYDEDPADHDDRLGNVHVDVNEINDDWRGFDRKAFKIKKRMGSKRAYTLRGCAALVSRRIKMSGEVIISVENLGKSEGRNGGQPYTVGPLAWSEHHSPLIGMIAGTKDTEASHSGKRRVERYNFRAVQMQLQGPVPEPLYHRYVEFKPFIAGMFTSHTLKGRILNHAAHHQHYRIYNFDETTKYGSFDKPCREMSEKFLDFVHYDQGGRIFTYVLTLDGLFRFTETGKEFGIDMLSKHTMHSNVSIYIAFSGEFFIRRLKNPHKHKNDDPDPEMSTRPPAEHEQANRDSNQARSPEPAHMRHESTLSIPGQSPSEQTARRKRSFTLFRPRAHSQTSSLHSHATQTHAKDDPSRDISHYELIIDNDSGTYRPNAKHLPDLKKFFKSNFPGLKVVTLDCQKDEEKMKRLKHEQTERKKNSGDQIMYMQNSSMDSLSSSDEEELHRRASGVQKPVNALSKAKKKVKGIVLDNDSRKSTDTAEDQKVKNRADDGKHGTKPESDHLSPQSQRSDREHGVGDTTESPTAMTDGSADQKHASRPQTALSEANLQRNNIAHEQNQHPMPQRQSNPSDIESRLSFNTAFTDHANDQFVTPKPSLGDGGLRQFTSKSNLQQNTHINQHTRDDPAHDNTYIIKGRQAGRKDGDVTPTANGHIVTEGRTTHQAVTSLA